MRNSSAILLGRGPAMPAGSTHKTIGFHQLPAEELVGSSDYVSYDRDRHMLTVAGSGQGKSRLAIATLLSYKGPMLVLDMKSELYRVTARARQEMGQQVICLDPAGVTGSTDALNPFDVFRLAIASVELEAVTLANQLSDGLRGSREPFWDASATALLAGLIAYMITVLPQEQQTLKTLRQKLHTNDNVYDWAVILDTVGKKMSRMAYEEIAALLQMPDQNTRPSVIATAQSYLKAYVSPGIEAATNTTSFDLHDWVAGKPMTIYIVIPPYRFNALKGLFKMWIFTLMMGIMSRTVIPVLPNLCLLDECAALGPFSYLQQMHAVGRGYGIRIWSMWQSFGQLMQNFPEGWQEIFDNCGVIQCFGSANYRHAVQAAELIGVQPKQLAGLRAEEQLLSIEGQPLISQKLDYLTDKHFNGLFDPNPFYTNFR